MIENVKKRPRVLIVDDQLGRDIGRRNRDREDFCFSAGLKDISSDRQWETVPDPCADAYFLSAQVERGFYLENELPGSLDFIRTGFRSTPRWSLVFIDLHFKTGKITNGEPEGRDEDRDPRNYFGLILLRAIRNDKALENLPVVILSSMVRSEVEDVFSDLDVFDFCDKSLMDRQKMQALLAQHGLFSDNRLIGDSLDFLICLREARRRAQHGGDNILITGETGTGKELLANYIHRWSGRNGPYIPLFTQGVPETLIEDRLFGHEKGAYAGAITAAAGSAEQADKGTLFIDEFGDIPLNTQTKLLRLLDINIRETQRLGAIKAKKVDIQVVMATSRMGILRSDDFRADLLQRAKADQPIELPPLRKRKEDIPLLADHLVRYFEKKIGAERRVIPVETLNILQSHQWPGNVRELERVIERAILQYKGLRILSPRHLEIPRIPESSQPPKSLRAEPRGLSGFRIDEFTSESTEAFRKILACLSEIPYSRMNAFEIVGSYSEVRETMARCLSGLLRQALIITSRPTPGNPQGRILYTPAIHLLLGIGQDDKKKWGSARCADIVLKIIDLSVNVREELLKDDILAKAFYSAYNLRRKRNKRA